MADLSFGTTVDLLKNALDGAGANQVVLSNNIANVNTPNFRGRSVAFKNALALSLGDTSGSDDTLGLVVDNPLQIPVDDPSGPQPYTTPDPVYDAGVQMRVDGSNIDLDQQMGELADNAGYQQTMAQLLKVHYTQLDTIFKETP